MLLPERGLAVAGVERHDNLLIDQRRHAVVASERTILRRGRQGQHIDTLLVAPVYQIATNTMLDAKPYLLLDPLERRNHYLARAQIVPLTSLKTLDPHPAGLGQLERIV